MAFFFSIRKKVRNYFNYNKAKILSAERIDIYSGKATIKHNNFGVWQFRMRVSNKKRYYEKSLRTKHRAEANGEKVNNYALAKQVGIGVEQRNTEEEWDTAYKQREVSVAVNRKKKVAIDAIKSVVNGVFSELDLYKIRPLFA